MMDKLINELLDEISKLEEAFEFYSCGCKRDKCLVIARENRNIKCGWIAREALNKGEAK